MPNPIKLGALLRFSPLTLLEVADRHAIRESSIAPRKGHLELPYWFFQYEEEGQLVVATPGGMRSRVAPEEVTNVVQAPSVRVMAMPRSVFIERLRHVPSAQVSEEPSSYRPAFVVLAQRDRWGSFDYHVRFEDPAFNDSDTYFAPLLASDRARIKPLTNRRNMPVRNYSASSPWSCDAKSRSSERARAKLAKAFFSAALQGDPIRTHKLSELDARA